MVDVFVLILLLTLVVLMLLVCVIGVLWFAVCFALTEGCLVAILVIYVGCGISLLCVCGYLFCLELWLLVVGGVFNS